ncbi:MAG: hypothetical protein J6X03_01740 [Bacilli bacterium]|nr:hypothetical protein [Bacilli bacterium]
MTKGGLAKRLLFALIWGILAVLAMLVAFATFSGIAGANVEPIFGSHGLSIPNFAGTWLDVLADNWLRGLFLAKVNEGFGAFLTMFTSLWDPNAWTLGLNGVVFYCFAAAIAIYVIFFIYYLIWGLFIYKKKKSMILNIFWSLIPLAIVLYLLVFLQGAVYGKGSYAGLANGDLAKGYVMQLVNATVLGGANGAETKSIIKAWATFIVACIAVIFVIVSLVYCALYGFGVVAYLKRHKYDYLEKAERKKRQKYYKTHGFENVASKQQEPVYAAPYPYSYQQPQVVLPPNGGNSVQTGNNAPLVVQYINTSNDDKKVKDDETSIYAAKRIEEQPQLTKEDIKDVVVAVLAENNLIGGPEEVEEGISEVELRTLVHEAIEEAKPAERPIPPLVVSVPEKVERIKEAQPAPAEEPAPVVEEKAEEEGITEDQLRALVAEEIANALSNLVVEEEPVKEEPKPVAKPAAKPAPVAQKPAPAPQPKPQPAPVQPRPRTVVPRGREQQFKNKEARESIENLSFNERLAKASPEIVEAYNSLKNLLVSYGLKNRVSNSGDTFRLHKNTYAKITLGGSQLKVYFALNPADYANSAIPVGDASGKDIYKDIPLVFRVKSNLSLRRARDLVNDTMNKAGIAKEAEEGNVDYVGEVKKELRAQARAAKKAAQK